jgi:hypothetical protein
MQTFIETGDRKLNNIQARFEELPKIFNKFESAQSELELSDDVDHSGEREIFEGQYFEVKAKFNEVSHPAVNQPRSRHNSGSSSSESRNTSPRSHGSNVHIKLPVISLPTFDGKICNWLQYRDTFEALIVNNTTLSNVQKFYYFIASLNNEAKDLIANLHVTNENFLVAWQLVTQRYNNKRLIAMMHAKHLCQMPPVKQGDASSLCQLINHVSSHTNAIQALSVNVPVQDLMLNHLMLATLDNDTHQQWELNTALHAEIPTTAELITFLEARCRALELIQYTQSPSMATTNSQATTPSMKTATTKPQGQQSGGSKVSKPVQCYVATQTQCTLCNGLHRLFKCGKLFKLQPRQRHNHAKQQGLCFNCLQPFVKGHTCSQQQCRICHKRHHTLLHVDKQNQAVNANRTTTKASSPAVTRDETSAEGNTYHTFKGKPRNHVILATAVVEVRDKTGQYVPC